MNDEGARALFLTDVVDGFIGRWEALSNYYPWKFRVNGLDYASSEHYFQSRKVESVDAARQIRNAETPDEAKHLANTFPRRPDWPDIRVGVMRKALAAKFVVGSYPSKVLIRSGNAVLLESNNWNDEEWGICEGKGANILGVLLVERRGVLRFLMDD